jgi:protein NirF
MSARTVVIAAAVAIGALALLADAARAELGLVVERASGSLQLVDNVKRVRLARVDGLGDLSHASLVYSHDGRFAYVFGRDGGLTKVEVASARVVARVVQAGNSIGGAISRDGRLVAVANYEPGGVKLFDAQTLELLSEIPATYGSEGKRAKVVGIVDAPGDRFVWSLFEAGEIWIAEVADPRSPRVHRLPNVGREPYDALITPDGRHYIAGLFGEDGLALVDLVNPEAGATRILAHYGRGQEKLPVYKMPHLRGWAVAGRYAFLPAIGRHEVLVVDRATWREVARIPAHGQPVFVMARPDGRQVWVNFALPRNDTVQVIDVERLAIVQTLRPGKTVLHMEFNAAGSEVWISARDDDRIVVYDTASFARVAELAAASPSGIFFTWRAKRIGM